MIGIAKRTLRKITKGQKGQALPIVLLLLVIGGLLIVPTLRYASASLKVGQMHEERMAELYTADAGIENGLWKIMHDPAVQTMEYDDPPITYNLSNVNHKVVTVSITKHWLLEGLESPHKGTAPHSDWAVVGRVDSPGVYEITITFTGSGKKRLERIGVWLPAGFGYVVGSSSGITTGPPNVEANKGGIVLTWDWQPGQGPEFKVPQGETEIARSQVFHFTPAEETAEGSFAWVRFQSKDIFLSWDGTVFNFNILSGAKDTAASEWLTQIESNVTSRPDNLAVITWEISLQ